MSDSGSGTNQDVTTPSVSDSMPWIRAALEEMGQAEVPGPKHNKRILEYHSTTSLQAEQDEVPWCSSFVNWCFKRALIRGTGKANARSWLTWGYPMEKPVVGCVVILSRGTNHLQGHVGFFWQEDDATVTVLGGNQNNRVCFKKYPRENVLGYRWPFRVLV